MAEPTAVTDNGLKKKTFTFFSDVSREMKKVTWPNRQELQDASIITLVLCVALAAFTFAADKVFEVSIRGLFNMF